MSKKIKLQPLKNTLFIIKDRVKDKTDGNIYFPAFNKYTQLEDRKINTGTVLAVGELHHTAEHQFKINDRVFFGIYAGVPVFSHGVLIHVMLVDEITGYFYQFN